MSEKEYKEFMSSLQKQEDELKRSKAERQRYLKAIGIIDANGKVTPTYTELCTQKERA